ncbi:8-amino-7-oxononanoate synthase [Zea mays]|uniref:serine C-palmitoyltransferase n=1 Tax=Zea mays TaxID=4577 RepID=A0A1D6JIN5_MAIZE|nr:8-amino-7-oxononanoate synthase [Zea mays]
MGQWDALVDAALARLEARSLLRATRPIALAAPTAAPRTFDGPGPWDHAAVEIRLDRDTLHQWLAEGDEAGGQEEQLDGNLILFSGNDYMGLSSHPAVREAAVKAAQDYGMGPRGSALICGYTTYHKLVEESLARLKKKEDCLLCPTGFSANMAAITALGSITSLLSPGRKPAEHERIAIFSDALNHASIIDGIRLLERQQEALVFVYKHCDMFHLDFLLYVCSSLCSPVAHWKRKLLSQIGKSPLTKRCLFSMDGDFAPFPELIKLRRKYGYLLVIDDAHGTLVCGENGGGAAELFECEKDIDIGVGTLSKAAGCQGGFITCSTQWKRLIQSRGRSFIFSTALPVPVVASVHGNIHYLTHVPVLQIDVPFNNMLS